MRYAKTPIRIIKAPTLPGIGVEAMGHLTASLLVRVEGLGFRV